MATTATQGKSNGLIRGIMTNKCGIYTITNTITGDYYLGSSNDIGQRIRNHRWLLSKNAHHNPHLQNVWNKYGEQAFEFKVLLLCDVERKLIIEQGFLDLFKPAYNLAVCASAVMQGRSHTEEARAKMSNAHMGHTHTDEAKRKISEAQIGNTHNLGRKQTEEHKRKNSDAQKGNTYAVGYKHTDEARAKISEATKGNTYCLGHKHTDEARRKNSEAHKGCIFSEEHKRNLSEASKGRRLSEETCARISEANKGERHHNFGKHLSEETRAKISDATKMNWAKRKAEAGLTA